MTTTTTITFEKLKPWTLGNKK